MIKIDNYTSIEKLDAIRDNAYLITVPYREDLPLQKMYAYDAKIKVDGWEYTVITVRRVDENVLISCVRSVVDKPAVETFGGMIQRIRQEKQVSITELATKARVSTQTIYNLETGAGGATLKVLQSVLSVLGYKLAIQPNGNVK